MKINAPGWHVTFPAAGQPVDSVANPERRRRFPDRLTRRDGAVRLMITLFHDIPLASAQHTPDASALETRRGHWTYAELADHVLRAGRGLHQRGLAPGERVAVYLDKRPETVAALFAVTLAGGIAVPVNPALKPHQVAHVLRDCAARGLITSAQRLKLLQDNQAVTDTVSDALTVAIDKDADGWAGLTDTPPTPPKPRHVETDPALILYTSGSTGPPKGVVLSHRNLVAGVESVVSYLANTADDRILAALPLSFDYGLNQVTTALYAGGTAFLCDYLWPKELLRVMDEARITGLAGVPPLWNQLVQSDWPEGVADHLRYVTNSGGKLPRSTLDRLRTTLPDTRVFLMYGLTEAFRSTYLPPEELDRRPDSMGQPIPNARVQVIHPDGALCGPGETGELVHAGPLVALGYWNAPERTAQRFRPAPAQPPELPLGETAVWSGDLVQQDEDGFLYFMGRRDDMIKSSGYRISSTEVEEVLHGSGLVTEAAVVGVPHPILGEGILAIVTGTDDTSALRAACQKALPAFMVPGDFVHLHASLPRGHNGKIDRTILRKRHACHFNTDSS